MRKLKLTAALLAVLLTSLISTSCRQWGWQNSSDEATDTLPTLKADESINRATKFYAGISKEGVSMSPADEQAWNKYSKEIKGLLDISAKTRAQCDSLVKKDFSDFRDSIDLVFYPFSGADFLYPITIFPNADTYVLCGLEKAGSPFGANIKTDYAQYDSYRKALVSFLNRSYFITKDMKNDLDNDQLDGVCPVLTMLMATDGYEIISIENMKVDNNGNLVKADGNGNVMQYKFFKQGTKHEQTLYYFSNDVNNDRMDPNFRKYMLNTLPKHKVATYLKAASYLMHMPGFTDIRDYIAKYSQYVVEDDSGVPYKYLANDFDITLYGMYKRPLMVFTDKCIQPDLDSIYKATAASVKPLPFRIGYNNPSNWLCARRKKGK
ncbi:MAG: hypothetical protein IKX31_09445 [Muribaculaceae bacterium]|nr:hypothetical protein [Muribaculaceae bacterium]